MALPTALQSLFARVNAALDQLEAAVERRVSSDAAHANLDEELAILQDDRARLAVDLDSALARSRQLSETNEEVAARLRLLGSSVRGVIESIASSSPVGGGE
ncbi:MAG: DUF4164 family protein [Hyphomicrobiales bacterium]|nr:DUF4164 family protein [Hyphomicrobiales bacterium]